MHVSVSSTIYVDCFSTSTKERELAVLVIVRLDYHVEYLIDGHGIWLAR